MADNVQIHLKKIDTYRWLMPREGGMRTDGMVYADERMMGAIQKDQSLQQVRNVAFLPGIVGPSLAMPDIHWGYGFPIGGVAAFDEEEGVVSPGGVGYDINCGVRLLCSGLERTEVQAKIRDIVDALLVNIPSGVGSHRKDLKLEKGQQQKVLQKGAQWAVEHGYGSWEDLEHIEEQGRIPDADPDLVSSRALERGRAQLGTLGSGNHFVEVGYVAQVYDEGAARVLGLAKDQVTVIVHTGSRGLGHQVCDDSIRVMLQAAQRYGIELPDKQLCCAPIKSKEGKAYLAAMACAANFAFANRQIITHWVRETFEQCLKRGPHALKLSLIYDVCHNIAKLETHTYGGKERRLCVHRKGATRAFPPHHPAVPAAYQESGQPVLIPGDMGRCSYVLVGTQQAYEETFGSTCHGAGRVMSRHQAKKSAQGRSVTRELEAKGIYVRAASMATLVEEIPEAYKDVSDVVDIVQGAGIGKKVAQLKPLGVIKG
ncbi:MAG: RNA-splicing ligase RtcB [Deltaproteobacteria bacterium RBG_16_54_18]|nr:MAG: RNA-splicing ligase RtcB [Deltaproteobacteria bacterium RBG_16_54_18]